MPDTHVGAYPRMEKPHLSPFKPYGLEHCGFVAHPDTGEWCKLYRNGNGYFCETSAGAVKKLAGNQRTQ